MVASVGVMARGPKRPKSHSATSNKRALAWAGSTLLRPRKLRSSIGSAPAFLSVVVQGGCVNGAEEGLFSFVVTWALRVGPRIDPLAHARKCVRRVQHEMAAASYT